LLLIRNLLPDKEVRGIGQQNRDKLSVPDIRGNRAGISALWTVAQRV
jgi:hypothetical protein